MDTGVHPLGFLLGGTSAAIVITLGKRLGLDPKTQTLLELESTITNIYNVVFVLAFLQFILTPNPDWTVPVKSILSAFSVSIVFGILVGSPLCRSSAGMDHSSPLFSA